MPSLSGHENVMLGLLAMGFTPEEAEEIRPSVIDLAQIGRAIHTPMNTYSSGMGARLRFAISVAARPKILMVDEALATGDASFQARSKAAMDAMIERAGTVFLVNHSRDAIEGMCNRVIWLEDGEIVADGKPEQKMEQYMVYVSALAREEDGYANEFLSKVKDTYLKQRAYIG
jgi:teichoic acid transport system ATP-binding protein